MKQLINITTVPIQYELKVQNARLQYKNSTAEVEISRDKGGMTIKSRPVKLNIDSFEARNSVVPTTARSVAQTAQKGIPVPKKPVRMKTAQMIPRMMAKVPLYSVAQYMAESGWSPKAVRMGTIIIAKRPQANPML